MRARLIGTGSWDGHLASLAATEPETPIWTLSSNRPPTAARTREFSSNIRLKSSQCPPATIRTLFGWQFFDSSLVKPSATELDWFAIILNQAQWTVEAPAWLGCNLGRSRRDGAWVIIVLASAARQPTQASRDPSWYPPRAQLFSLTMRRGGTFNFHRRRRHAPNPVKPPKDGHPSPSYTGASSDPIRLSTASEPALVPNLVRSTRPR